MDLVYRGVQYLNASLSAKREFNNIWLSGRYKLIDLFTLGNWSILKNIFLKRLKEVYDCMNSTIKMQPLRCGVVRLNRQANETTDFNY